MAPQPLHARPLAPPHAWGPHPHAPTRHRHPLAPIHRPARPPPRARPPQRPLRQRQATLEPGTASPPTPQPPPSALAWGKGPTRRRAPRPMGHWGRLTCCSLCWVAWTRGAWSWRPWHAGGGRRQRRPCCWRGGGPAPRWVMRCHDICDDVRAGTAAILPCACVRMVVVAASWPGAGAVRWGCVGEGRRGAAPTAVRLMGPHGWVCYAQHELAG